MQPITAWAGLIAEAQATPRFAQPRRQLRQNLGTVLENPELADLAAAATLRNRHSDRRLVHIQPDISDSIHQARLPCMRLCAGHPAQPSTFCMPRGGPPITQRTSGLNGVSGKFTHFCHDFRRRPLSGSAAVEKFRNYVANTPSLQGEDARDFELV